MTNEKPFLTIVTRHLPERAKLLERNQISLMTQTDPDCVPMVKVDDVPGGGGWGKARQMLIEASWGVLGSYVLILDDDDFMQARDGIESLKAAVAPHPGPLPEGERGKLPPVVIFKGYHSEELGVLPRTHWKQAPVQGDIGCFDFILRADVFKQCVLARGQNDYAHDFDIISAAYTAHAEDVVWLDKIICAADKRRMGK